MNVLLEAVFHVLQWQRCTMPYLWDPKLFPSSLQRWVQRVILDNIITVHSSLFDLWMWSTVVAWWCMMKVWLFKIINKRQNLMSERLCTEHVHDTYDDFDMTAALELSFRIWLFTSYRSPTARKIYRSWLEGWKVTLIQSKIRKALFGSKDQHKLANPMILKGRHQSQIWCAVTSNLFVQCSIASPPKPADV